MGEFRLSKRSRDNMRDLHPALVRVIERAIELTPIDFGVSEGLRTEERQKQLYAEGKTTTMQSRHLAQDDGFSHAVDLFVIVEGKVSWMHKDFRRVIQAVFTAAIEERVQVEAGALWRDFLDSPHIELNREYDHG